MSKIIVVIGITGNQGGSVAQTYLKEPGWIVRGVTRNVNSESSKKLKAQGVQLVSADLDDPSGWPAVFSGAHAIFAMTDFWAPFGAKYPELSKVSDRATAEYAVDVEQKRAKTFVDAAAKVLAEEQVLEMFIWSSLPPFKELSGGKYTFCYHFDGKAEINKYIEISHPDLWKITSVLNMGFYYNKLQGQFAPLRIQKLSDDSYLYNHAGPDDTIHPMVYPGDCGTFTKLLIDNKPGINLLGVSQKMSNKEQIQIWSEELGVKAQSQETTVEEADKTIPGGFGREVAESSSTSAEFGWGTLTLPEELDPEVKLTSFRDYVKRADWSIVTGAGQKR